MTNVMAATYPELFKAATAYSGVAAGCFVSTGETSAPAAGSTPAWNSTCAQGQVDASPEYWTSVVKAMDEGYSGHRPRFQVYHGSIDTTLYPENYNETVKEWTGVFGYDYTSPYQTKANFPKSGYTTDIWGVTSANPLGTVQGIYALNVSRDHAPSSLQCTPTYTDLSISNPGRTYCPYRWRPRYGMVRPWPLCR